jgi:hypothetical protein
MIASGTTLLAGAGLVAAGMATTIAGILAPALFLPGVIVIGGGRAVAAAGGLLSLSGVDAGREPGSPARQAAPR